MLIYVAKLLPRQDWFSRTAPPRAGSVIRADEIADFLKKNLHPDDTVQTLDWNGGATHGALLAGARPATRFIYDFHFYHDVSKPCIQDLRRRLLREMDRSRPRFIVQSTGERSYPQGADTASSFPELDHLIATDYRLVKAGWYYNIYERMQ